MNLNYHLVARLWQLVLVRISITINFLVVIILLLVFLLLSVLLAGFFFVRV